MIIDKTRQNGLQEFNSENLAVAIQNAFPVLSHNKRRLKEVPHTPFDRHVERMV